MPETVELPAVAAAGCRERAGEEVREGERPKAGAGQSIAAEGPRIQGEIFAGKINDSTRTCVRVCSKRDPPSITNPSSLYMPKRRFAQSML